MENKILISWISPKNDFFVRNKRGEMLRSETGFNEDGPHINLYKNFLDFDTHYLLCAIRNGDTDIPTEWEFLANRLRKDFNIKVIIEKIIIKDVVSVGEIKGKVFDLIKTKFSSQDKIDIFINPGTPAMQTSWYLINNEINNINIFIVREARFTKNKIKPEREYVKLQSSYFGKIINYIEISKDKNFQNDKNFFSTKTYDEIYNRAKLISGNSKTTVHISGDTGTGKEILARFIHDNSNRKKQEFIPINCGAFRDELLESRLFGYMKGAFTGATETTKGIFEKADGGTVFLDEIGDISAQMQVTLLRVLQEKEITKIGSTKIVKTDFRIISATNKNLWELCVNGTFRLDLFYRLVVTELSILPFVKLPNKEKRLWIEFFLEKKAKEFEVTKILTLSKEVWEILYAHNFIGNLRELEAIIENFYVFCYDKDVVTLEYVSDRLINTTPEFSIKLDHVIKKHILKTIKDCNGNISAAARILGKSNNTVLSWQKKQLS